MTSEEWDELQRSQSTDSDDSAASILNIIRVEYFAASSEGDPTKKPCFQGLCQKLKAFFVLYLAKANFDSVLNKLCCQTTTRRAGSVEMVMEEASPILKELVSEQAADSQGCEVCVYERVSQDITSGQYQDLSQRLRDVIFKFMAPQKRQSTFSSKVRQDVDTFMENILIWVKIQQQQQQQPARKKPVKRALRRIRRLASNMATPTQNTERPLNTDSEDNLIYNSIDSVALFVRLKNLFRRFPGRLHRRY